jgi:hypothetical protein
VADGTTFLAVADNSLGGGQPVHTLKTANFAIEPGNGTYAVEPDPAPPPGPSLGDAKADLLGNYIVTGLTNGTYVVTMPDLSPTWSSSPTARSVSLQGASVTGQDFKVRPIKTSSPAQSRAATAWQDFACVPP